VLVIGHSLNDPALVRDLSAVAAQKKVAISYFDERGAEYVQKAVPDAIPVRMDFGPELDLPRQEIHALRE